MQTPSALKALNTIKVSKQCVLFISILVVGLINKPYFVIEVYMLKCVPFCILH